GHAPLARADGGGARLNPSCPSSFTGERRPGRSGNAPACRCSRMQTTRHVRRSRAGHDVDMKWRERAVAPGGAVRGIRRGERVFVGSAWATPRPLLRALEAQAPPPAGVHLVHFLTDGAVLDRDGRARSSFRHCAFYLGRDMLQLSLSDGVDYVPMSLSEVPRLLESRRLTFDVALVQVSPPDAAGI